MVTEAMHGFAMPAEWTRHDAVWTAWPYAEEQWGEGLAEPRRALMDMCRAIVDMDAAGQARGERVELLVRHAEDEHAARALLGNAALGVRFHHWAYGDVWLRDTSAIFLQARGAGGIEQLAARFRFDGWGGKYVMPGDAEVSAAIAQASGFEPVQFDFVLEGGAVEVDGVGNIMTTRQCLLRGGRNHRGLGMPLSEAAMNARLCYALGGDHVIWLDDGLQNDHTDGHIDTIARFVAPGVVACMEPGQGDPNRDAMRAIIDALRVATDAHGRKLEVLTVPSPGAVLDAQGALLPASYMNFYVANTVVVVPTYDSRHDDAAVAAIGAMFGTRRVVALPCKPVVIGGGGFHCTTQQQPALGEEHP